jgi:HEPN domain-containing protein
MVNVQKQIDYWRAGAVEEWKFAGHILDEGDVRHGMFFVHLSLEKIIKAHVCKKTGGLAPQIHTLLKLLDTAGLVISQEDREFLGEMTQYNIAGRYPDLSKTLPPPVRVEEIRQKAERIYSWLLSQL